MTRRAPDYIARLRKERDARWAWNRMSRGLEQAFRRWAAELRERAGDRQ